MGSRPFGYQLCQKLCQPPLPQPALCQPPFPQPPLCQPPLPQPRRPQPAFPHQAGVALASPCGSKLFEPVRSETPARIACRRVDTASPEVGCETELGLDTASASVETSASRTDAPNAPAGSTAERALNKRFDCAMGSPESLGNHRFQCKACRKVTTFSKTSQDNLRRLA